MSQGHHTECDISKPIRSLLEAGHLEKLMLG